MIPPSSQNLPGPAPRPMPSDVFRGVLSPHNGYHVDGVGNGMATVGSAAHPGKVTPGSLLKALRRRWFLGFSLGVLLAAGGATAAWCFLPPSKYVARTRLHVDAEQQAILFPQAFRTGDFSAYQRHQMALVKSRLVFTTAMRNEAVARLPILREELEPLEWLEREVRVDFSQSPNILQISMVGEDPEQLVVLVNAIREAYLKEIVNKEFNQRHEHFEKLQKYYTEYQQEVTLKRGTLKQLAEQRGLTSTTSNVVRQTLLEERLKGATKRLLEVQSQLFNLDAGTAERTLRQKEFEKQRLSDSEIESAVLAHEVYRQGKLELERAEASLKQAGLKVEAGSPLLAKYEKAVKDANARLAQLKKELWPSVEKELFAAAGRQLRLSEVEMTKLVERLRRYETLALEDIKDLTDQLEKVKRQSVDTLDMDQLQKEVDRSEGLLKKIADAKEALRIELPQPPRVQRLEEGVVSRNQDDKKRLIATGIAGLGGMGLALFLVSWFELRVCRINTVDEVSTGLGMRIVGAIPGVPGRNWRNLVAGAEARHHYWRRLLTESVDAARTMLLHSAQTEGIKVVMISSAVGGEGKTSLASHLAASLVRAGRKTLLIDGDLRKPTLHRLFDVALMPGLGEYLRDEAEPEAVMQSTSCSGLHLIAAGKGDPQAIQALSRDRLRRLLKRAREDFDFVLVDTSPVLPVADALLIAQHVDGVLFSILRDVSRFPKVFAAYQRLAALGARILGAVVSGARSESYGSEYYSYYADPVGTVGSQPE